MISDGRSCDIPRSMMSERDGGGVDIALRVGPVAIGGGEGARGEEWLSVLARVEVKGIYECSGGPE